MSYAIDTLEEMIANNTELERRLASNINFLGELKTKIGNVKINEDEKIDLMMIIVDLECIREELDPKTPAPQCDVCSKVLYKEWGDWVCEDDADHNAEEVK